MPALWDKIDNPAIDEYGVDISEASGLTNVQGVQPAVWLPDIVFPDATSIVKSEEYLKLFPTGQLRRMQHLIMTFSQSSMRYMDYPCDTQNITISFFSFTLTAHQLVFQPVIVDSLALPPVDLIYSQGSTIAAFAENPIWSLTGTSAGYTTWQLSPGLFERPFGIVTFRISRKSTGVLRRLCVPVLLIMLLCAMSYWGTLSDRIATTVTGLLAVAALYISIVNSIPLVGYMTRLDDYMLMMFVIVFVNTILHMVVVRMNVAEKGTNWPLRKLVVRVVEFTGRVTMIPWIIATYIVSFLPSIVLYRLVIIVIALAAFEVALWRRYLPELRDTVITTIEHIELKQKLVARTNKVSISSLELRFLWWVRPYFPSNTAPARDLTTLERGDGKKSDAVEVEMQSMAEKENSAAGKRESGEFGTINPMTSQDK
jgi:hypothetical protein